MENNINLKKELLLFEEKKNISLEDLINICFHKLKDMNCQDENTIIKTGNMMLLMHRPTKEINFLLNYAKRINIQFLSIEEKLDSIATLAYVLMDCNNDILKLKDENIDLLICCINNAEVEYYDFIINLIGNNKILDIVRDIYDSKKTRVNLIHIIVDDLIDFKDRGPYIQKKALYNWFKEKVFVKEPESKEKVITFKKNR